MSIRLNNFEVPNVIAPEHVLMSLFDKAGLEFFVQGLTASNPNVTFYSSTGTGKAIQRILEEAGKGNYIAIEDLTGVPEMEGGLVKTLTPQVFAGILAERNNPEHEEYLTRTLRMPRKSQWEAIQRYIREEDRAVALQAAIDATPVIPYFDIVAVNFYPFSDVVANPQTSRPTEEARSHIDIGGPSMVAAGAKNWHSVAVVTDPRNYSLILEEIARNGGTTKELRRDLSNEANTTIAQYRGAIDAHMGSLNFEDIVRDILLEDLE